jgi:hypothetical protein
MPQNIFFFCTCVCVIFISLKLFTFKGIRWNSHNFDHARLRHVSSWSFHLLIKVHQD